MTTIETCGCTTTPDGRPATTCPRCAAWLRILGRPTGEVMRLLEAATREAQIILHPLLAARGADPDVEAIAERAGGRWAIRGALVLLERAEPQ